MKLRSPPLAALALTAALALAGAARAQDDSSLNGVKDRLKQIEKQLHEVRSIVLQARATGHPVEVKDAGPDPQVLALQGKVDDIGQSMTALTGQVETLGHDVEQARKDLAQSQAASAALADRVAALEKQVAALASPPPPGPAAGQPGAPPAPGAPAAASAGPDAKDTYAHAHKLLLDGDYPGAAAAFQDFIDRFGDSPSAPSARYWLGEVKYIQSDYDGAAQALFAAIRGWPQTTWAPDAMIKLSLALVELGKPQDACRTLVELDRHYPHLATQTKVRAKAALAKAGCAG
jgi:tol-pal system protein YbgF